MRGKIKVNSFLVRGWKTKNLLLLMTTTINTNFNWLKQEKFKDSSVHIK